MPKKVEELKDTQVDRGVLKFSHKTHQQKLEKSSKINGKYFYMQVDTDITLIPVNFWQDLEKLRVKKSALQLKQFNVTIIKTLRTIEGMF